MRILITGGAGFVGGAMARELLRGPDRHDVVLFDNLKRRGSEWNLRGLVGEGATFVHGDVRNRADFDALHGSFDVLIEASAEASVHAGIGDSPRYVLDTNVGGAINCLEFARERCAGVVFLSSSRVYPLLPLRSVGLVRDGDRFELDADANRPPGLSSSGISEEFPSEGPRSFYGASKLAGELICLEYAANCNLPVVINRCGVIAGAGQFGRTDQGIFTLWVARHQFQRPLTYTGFGGLGLQVRDLLHPADLIDLLRRQWNAWDKVSGRTFNVGGGRAGSVSLREYTSICSEVTGRSLAVAESAETSPVDIPWYISDHRLVSEVLDWKPTRSPRAIAQEIQNWIEANEDVLSMIIV